MFHALNLHAPYTIIYYYCMPSKTYFYSAFTTLSSLLCTWTEARNLGRCPLHYVCFTKPIVTKSTRHTMPYMRLYLTPNASASWGKQTLLTMVPYLFNQAINQEIVAQHTIVNWRTTQSNQETNRKKSQATLKPKCPMPTCVDLVEKS